MVNVEPKLWRYEPELWLSDPELWLSRRMAESGAETRASTGARGILETCQLL